MASVFAAPRSQAPARLVPVLVGVTLVVAVVSSLGAPLLPDVATMLDVSLDSAQWSLTAALLAGAVAAPIMGRLGDGPYRREAILGGLAIVCAGGAVAGFAQSLAVLIAGRSMQGIGLGLAPITMAAARDHLPRERSPAVIGILSVTAAAGVGAGYPVTGLIAEAGGPRAAFGVGGLMSAVALVAALLVIPSSRESSHVPLDVGGALVMAAGLVALLLAIGQGAAWGWTSPTVLGLFAAAALILAAWVRQQLGRAIPLVDLHELRHRAVLTADVAAIMLGLALYMFLTLVSSFVQTPTSTGYGFGSSTLVAGLCLLPFSVLSLTASRTIEPVTRRFGPAAVLVGGSLTIAAAGAFFTLLHGALWQAFVTMGVIGIGFGYTFAAIPGLIARSVPDHETGSAMGLYQVIRAIGFAMGSALAASILAGHVAPGSALPSEAGYTVALAVGTAVCALSAAVSWYLSRGGTATSPAALAQAERERLTRDQAELASAGLAGLNRESRRDDGV